MPFWNPFLHHGEISVSGKPKDLFVYLFICWVCLLISTWLARVDHLYICNLTRILHKSSNKNLRWRRDNVISTNNGIMIKYDLDISGWFIIGWRSLTHVWNPTNSPTKVYHFSTIVLYSSPNKWIARSRNSAVVDSKSDWNSIQCFPTIPASVSKKELCNRYGLQIEVVILSGMNHETRFLCSRCRL